MKKLIFLSIFLFLGLFANAQTVEFETEAYAIALYNNVDSVYEEWGEWELTTVNVFLDLDSGKVVIHSQYVQRYNLLNVTFTIENNSRILTFEAVDAFDQWCLIRLMYLEKFDKHHLYIVWKQLKIVYQMKKL